MRVRSVLVAGISLVTCAGCDAVQQGAERISSPWTVTTATDKLTGQTLTKASLDSKNEDGSLVGRMELECSAPSKKLQFTISSFGADGGGVAFEDSIAVRVRSAQPLNLALLLQNGLQGAAGGELLAALAGASSMSQPAQNIVQIDFDALLADLKGRASRASRTTPELEARMRLAALDSLRRLRAQLGDPDTTSAHLVAIGRGEWYRRELDSAGAMDPIRRLAARERDLLRDIEDAARDSLSIASNAASREAAFTTFANAHFGDVSSYHSAAELLTGMGPELVFQYYNATRRNTLTVKVADVGTVLNACR